MDSDEALVKFHRGQLTENEEEWYRLVPPEAREVLDRKEVTRQSILFEIVKSEKDYVADLELVQEVRLNHMVVCAGVRRTTTNQDAMVFLVVGSPCEACGRHEGGCANRSGHRFCADVYLSRYS